MKSCPTCNRTFEDTFTFCLIDGSVLSAPLEPAAAKSPRPARDSGSAKTEVLKVSPDAATLLEVAASGPQNPQPTRLPRETDPARAAKTHSPMPPTIQAPAYQRASAAAANNLAPTEDLATSSLTQWTYAIRGLSGVILALTYFLRNETNPRNILGSLEGFAILGGICMLIAGGKTLTEKRREWLVTIEGLIGLLFGFRLMQSASFVPPIEIASWMLANGIFQLVTSFRLRSRTGAWWLLGAAGVTSLLTGLMFLPGPRLLEGGARLFGFLKLIDGYLFVGGMFLLLFGIRLRSRKATTARA
jgi:uncharacterized membrane protein HdeD (DUF308 family)